MRKMQKVLALALALVVCLSVAAPGMTASAADLDSEAFAQEFEEPSNEFKPFVRWWVSPGAMTEEETRSEIDTFYEMGYGGVELVALGTPEGVQLNDERWNEAIKWIMKAAAEHGMQVDVTFTVGWPIATGYIADEDRYADTRTEQKLVVKARDFEVADGSRTCTVDGWIVSESTAPGGVGEEDSIVTEPNLDEHFTLLGATAMKKIVETAGEGEEAVTVTTYDDSQIIDLTDLVDQETGKMTWDASEVEAGTWTVFYSYQQGTGNIKRGVGPVLDPLSTEASDLVIRNYEEAFESDPELKELYQAVGGSFFGDSFEMNGTVIWSDGLIEAFEKQHGYDVTPYLPAIYAERMFRDASAPTEFEFTTLGEKVRMDYVSTISHMIADNHIGYLSSWAQEELDMTVRYQAHCSNSSFFVDETASSLGADIPETESYALGNSLDSYRTKSAVVHLQNKYYSAEAAEMHGRDWRETWTGSEPKTVSERTIADIGFMQYANRLFAAGVNMLVLHGASYHSEGAAFPGASGMAGMNYPNEWDDKTPLFEHAPEMLDYLARAQLLLRQGQGDIDLAIYRNFATPTQRQAGPYDLNRLGYNFDYVTEEILNLDNVFVGDEDGHKVLAPEGPSYKALVIDQRTTSEGSEPFTMSVNAAEKVLGYAQAGLPVVIVGSDPIAPGTDPEDAARVTELMAQLKELPSCIQIEDISQLDGELNAIGITPDADPEESSEIMFYHRRTADADYYFLANDSATEPMSRKVTLRGEGRPYLLNGWTGEITPIAQYTAGEGTVTIDVDLAGGAQLLLAVAPAGSFGTAEIASFVTGADEDTQAFYSDGRLMARTFTGGEHSVTLNGGSSVTLSAEAPEDAVIDTWEMVVHQWMPMDPDDLTVDPYTHRIVDSEAYTLNNADGMLAWYEIDEENLLHAMGVAEYTATFSLEKGWAEGQGAILRFTDVTDTMKLTVNGTVVTVDQVAKDADIGPWLKAGENTIKVEVASSAANFKYARDWSGDWCFWDFGQTDPDKQMFDKSADGCTYKFGILGPVSLDTYTVTAVPAGPGSYNDLSASAWYAEPVGFMLERGYMTGVSDTAFAPKDAADLAAAVTVLGRFANGQGASAADAMAWAVEEGIVTGSPDPDGPVTREQLAVLLYRCAGSPAASQTLTFTDAGSVSDDARSAMAWCVANGILNGYSDNTIRPSGYATRAEMARMMTSFIRLQEA